MISNSDNNGHGPVSDDRSFSREERIKKHPLGELLTELRKFAGEAKKLPDGPFGNKSVEHTLHRFADRLLADTMECLDAIANPESNHNGDAKKLDELLGHLARESAKMIKPTDKVVKRTDIRQDTSVTSSWLELYLERFVEAHKRYAANGHDPVAGRINGGNAVEEGRAVG